MMGGGVRDSGLPGLRGFEQAGCAKARRDRIAGAVKASPQHGEPFRLADSQPLGVGEAERIEFPPSLLGPGTHSANSRRAERLSVQTGC